MKKRFTKFIGAVVLLTITGWSTKAQETSQAYEFDLQQCIDYALENNQNLKNKGYERGIADAQVKQYLSGGYPQINASAGLNYNFEQQKSLLPPERLGINPNDVPADQLIDGEMQLAFQQKYSGDIKFSARQLIFDGSFFVGLEAARTYTEVSRKDYVKTQIDVAQDVSKAYYMALVTKERLSLLEKNFSRLDSLLRDTKAMYDNGFVEKIDYSRIKVQVNNLKTQLDNTIKLAELTNDILKLQMGVSVSSTLTLSQGIDEINFVEPNPIGEEFNYEDRIEYSQLVVNKQLVQLDMKNNKSKYMPNLYANAVYGYGTQTDETSKWFKSERWLNYGFVGATLNMPIFDGFYKRSLVQKNKLQLMQVEKSFELLENSIDLEHKQAKINLENSVKSMGMQKENMELAEEVFKISEIKYKEGVGANSEVLDADTALKEAQTNYYNALYEALVAKIDLEKAYGTLLNRN